MQTDLGDLRMKRSTPPYYGMPLFPFPSQRNRFRLVFSSIKLLSLPAHLRSIHTDFQLSSSAMPLPLHTVKDWAPFRLDALGLVTLLRAEEVNVAIGALQHSLFTECLPLFGTYMIAGNKFTRPIPGFALYNITDGVYVPIVNG